jgi:hypothetical protein
MTGYLLILLVFGLLGGWAAFAKLEDVTIGARASEERMATWERGAGDEDHPAPAIPAHAEMAYLGG